MARRAKKVTTNTVLGVGEIRQGMLFEDAFTDFQQQVLDASDGTRTINSIAVFLSKPKEKVLQIAKKFLHDGYLKILEADEVLEKCEDVENSGRLEDVIELYRSVLEDQPENYDIMVKLADLYTRTAYAREAAELYSKISKWYSSQARFGEALVVLRKASSLQSGNLNIQEELAKLCVQTGRNEEAARVWRAYAMRLAGTGEFQEALKIIDGAVTLIGGNDTLFYAEAEILALMEGKVRNEKINVPEEEVVSTEFKAEVLGDTETYQENEIQNNSENINSESTDVDSNVALSDIHSLNDDEVAEIISEGEQDYSDIRIREYEQQEKVLNKTSGSGRVVWLVLVFIAFVLFILAGINYYYRSKMYSAVLESKGIGSLIQQADLLDKIEISQDAFHVLNKSKPPFKFMQSSEYANQVARIEQLVENTSTELLKNNIAFDKVVEEWELNHNEVIANRILQFSNSSAISEDRQGKAQALYNEWLQEKEQKNREVKDTIEVLADKKLDSKSRFRAYRNLLLKFPYVFEHEYPKGVKGLTVPSRIKAEIAETGTSVDLKLTGASKNNDGYWEIPVSSNSNVFIEHYGYSIGNSRNIMNTQMPYPLTFEQLIILNKEPIIDIKLDLNFTAEIASVVDDAKKIILSDRNDFIIADISDFKVISKGSYSKNGKDSVRSVGLDIFSLNNWAGVLNDGSVYVVDLNNTSKGFNFISKTNAGQIVFADMFDIELGNYDGVGVLLTSLFSQDKEKIFPVQILEVGNGKRIWDNNFFVNKLYKALNHPIIYADKILWYYLFIDSSGKLFVTMENGDIFKELTFGLNDKEKLSKDSVHVFKRNSILFVVAENKVFKIDFNSEPELTELWTLSNNNINTVVSDSGIIEYGDGRLSLYRLDNGEKLFDYNYFGHIIQQPVVVDDVVYIVLKAKDGVTNNLIALDVTHKSKPLLWSYKLKMDVKLIFGSRKRLFVLTEDGHILGFEK